MTRLAGKTALVTGGASGIGRETALLMGREGATVVVADVQDALGAEVAAAIGANGRYLHLDVTDEAGWHQVIATVEREFGGLDILVNNAGIDHKEILEETPLATYQRVIAVTQTSVFLGTKAAAALLKASGSGSVVNVSSIFGTSGGFGSSPAYHTAKGGVRTLTKNVAVEWAPLGVRVNSVHPGFIETPLMGDIDRTPLVDVTPLGRLGRAEEVAAAILFLASDESSFVTGSELYVDGGFLAR